MIELSATAVVLIVCMVLFAQLLALVGKQERVAAGRQVALRAAANRLEQLLAKDFGELAVTTAKDETTPAEVLKQLPSAQLSVQVSAVEPPAGEVAAKQIRVAITWRDAAGVTVPGVALTGWKHQSAEAAP
ncbi:hypothetical protein NA78x_004706 [Anatilimnocola sp. NA78]|uniref:hypothetical protein n=1 Tax=Anatilimnocola sp. NA78 TaxID=3415683 RepID=UPI003CE51C16